MKKRAHSSTREHGLDSQKKRSKQTIRAGHEDVLRQVQRGLFFSKPRYGVFMTLGYKQGVDPDAVKDDILIAVKNVLKFTLELERSEGEGSRTRAVVAFNPDQWKKWFPDIAHLSELEGRPTGPEPRFLIPTSDKFLDTGGDIFFLLKSNADNQCDKVRDKVTAELGSYCYEIDVTSSTPPSERIIQNSFKDGLANPCDTESLKNAVVNADIDSKDGFPGSTFLLTQKFKFNWVALGGLDQTQKEDMIGRRMTSDAFMSFTHSRAHMKCAHVIPEVTPIDPNAQHSRVFRLSMPYGVDGSGPGREQGVMYMHLCNTTEVFKRILTSIAGSKSKDAPGEVTVDTLLSNVQPKLGTWWYVPSAEELNLPTFEERRFDFNEHWNVRSPNEYMFYNQKEYLHRMTTGGYTPEDPPTNRVLTLVDYMFCHWNDQWFKKRVMPPMPHLFQNVKGKKNKKKIAEIQVGSVALRKGWAIKQTLGSLLTTNNRAKLEDDSFYGRRAGTFSIHPDDILAGRMPPTFSLGLGQIVMPYLHDKEVMPAFVKGLSEAGTFGHIIPDYQTLVSKGIGSLIKDLVAASPKDKAEKDFIASCILALNGIRKYHKNFAYLAKYMADNQTFNYSEDQRRNLREVGKRMEKLSKHKPDTFVEAVQLIFSFHCCLHLTGEPTSVGRLDQILMPFYNEEEKEKSQEIIDCFWLKLGEPTLLNNRLLEDQGAWGSCAVPFSSTGVFPNGDSINQWVQQVTVGGYKATDTPTPQDACNDVTILCLKASRRLPVNGPCLSLRMHKQMPQEVLKQAAKCILSGGAHPLLLHDDRLIAGFARDSPPDVPLDIKTRRDYACDGCYEPIFPGLTEFSLVYVPMLGVLEMTINHGSTYSMCGPAFLEGTPQSLPTAHAKDIHTFKQLKEIYEKHFRVRVEYSIYLLLLNYGNLHEVCPSPLLSTLVHDCIEAKRDLTKGGARHPLIGVQFISFSNTVDSLYAIKRLCFDHDSSVLSLADLVQCLKCDWGNNMMEPWHDELAGPTHGQRLSDFYKDVREKSLRLPKFGTDEAVDNKDIQELTSWLGDLATNTIQTVARGQEGQPLSDMIQSLKQKFSAPGFPWDIMLPAGSGTFEGYVGWGLGLAASADGRRTASPIASDFSAAPSPQDKPAAPKKNNIYKALKCCNKQSINENFTNGTEIDIKIEETCNEQDLVTFLGKYADQTADVGGNIMSVTCVNGDTLSQAVINPEKYDLVRVRTGGWSEFYITYFSAHQKHQQRRQYYHVPH